MIFIDRSVYNLFDFMRDLGGLVSGLSGLALIIVSILKLCIVGVYLNVCVAYVTFGEDWMG